MQQKTHTYLRFVRYKDLNLWDVKRFWGDLDLLFSSSVRLKDILSPHFEPVSKEEMLNKQWHIISKINFAGKLFLRDVSEAKTFKGNLNKIDSNTLIYSKINVKHGCIYFHPDNAEPFGVSSEYPAYKIDASKVSGAYLVKVIQSQYFKTLLNQKTSGISKARVKPYEFLDIKIPLPSLSEQQALIKSYNDKIQQAETLEKQASEIEQNIEDYLLTELGIKQNINTANHKDEIKKEYKYLKFIKFKDSERWDADFLFGTASIDYIYSSKFSIVHARDFILNCQYGSSNKADKNSSNIPVLRMNNIQNGEFNTADLKYLALSKKELSSYKLNKGDLVFNRTNSKELVGKTAVFDMDGDYVFASYLIRVVLDSAKANVYYINYLFGSKIVRDQIDLISRQILGQANINVDEMKAFLIPLPPLSVQEEIVQHINKIKTQVKDLHKQARELREKAESDFEKSVFE